MRRMTGNLRAFRSLSPARRRLVWIALALVALAAAPATSAQDFDGTIGYGGGGIWFGALDEGGRFALDAGWLTDAHVERWYGGRLGLRAHAAFTQRPLQLPGDTRDVNTWLIDGSALLHLLPPRADRAVAPFVSTGVGVVSYGLGEGRRVVIADDMVYPGDSDRQIAGIVGLGIDFLPGWNWWGNRVGLRLEAADHMATRSPFETAGGETFGPVHNRRLTLSLIGLVDLFP